MKMMQNKKRMVIGGFGLILLATIALFMTFGVMSKGKGPKVTRRSDVKAAYLKLDYNLVAKWFRNTQIIIAYLDVRRFMYGSFAGCIKESLNLEDVTIAIIPDLREFTSNSGVYIFKYGDGPPLEVFSSLRSEGGAIGGVRVREWFYGLGVGYGETGTFYADSWWVFTRVSDGEFVTSETHSGIYCAGLDTESFHEAVCHCIEEYPSLSINEEYGSIVIATSDAVVVINAQCEITYCTFIEWPGPGSSPGKRGLVR